MRIVLAGASGFLGSALRASLAGSGHETRLLTRGVEWDPDGGRVDAAALDGADAVVHLGGESLSAGRWTDARKERIRSSRVRSTALLAGAAARMAKPPEVFAVASAVGFYGDRKDEELVETSPPGVGFVPELCRAWEEAARPARDRGIRTLHFRTAIVLGPGGGILSRMIGPFRWGLGGRIGPGTQWWSWISIDDAVGAMRHALERRDLAGPVNLSAPGAVTNREFTRTLGRVLRRWTIFPLPAFAARLAFGEMADGLMLASARVKSARLLESGYAFRFPELEGALRHVLTPAYNLQA